MDNTCAKTLENPPLDHAMALRLAQHVVDTQDQTILRPYIDAMMTEGLQFAQAISAISGDKGDDFDLFMAMCEKHKLLSDDEANYLSDALVDAERSMSVLKK